MLCAAPTEQHRLIPHDRCMDHLDHCHHWHHMIANYNQEAHMQYRFPTDHHEFSLAISA